MPSEAQPASTARPGATASQESANESTEFDKTTAMLVTVLILFFITELPPSIAVVLEVFLGIVYYFECRGPVHYLMLMMYYVSGCFNFFVYLSMSRDFRATLLSFPVFDALKSPEEPQKRENPTGSSNFTTMTKL